MRYARGGCAKGVGRGRHHDTTLTLTLILILLNLVVILASYPRHDLRSCRSDVVFNAIDIGPAWDYCVNTLCLELAVPLVQGQSFGWKFNGAFGQPF